MPVTSVVPKAMFPLVDRRDKVRSVLHVICQQAASAGIESIGIVVSPWQREMIQHYFATVQQSNPSSLPAVDIEYIVQTSPKGFGNAVMQTVDFVGDDPFMLLLGDHIYVEDHNKPPCPAQVAEAFDSVGGVAMIGMQPVATFELSRVGVASGVEIHKNIYRCTDFVEKPDPVTARQQLVTADYPTVPIVFYSRKATLEDAVRCLAMKNVWWVERKPTGKDPAETIELTTSGKQRIAQRFETAVLMAKPEKIQRLKKAAKVITDILQEFR